MWLTSLARKTRVEHEHVFPGTTRKADVLFQAGDSQFVAEIATISDAGLDEENPVDAFHHEIGRVQRKLGLINGGFSIRFGSQILGTWRDRKVTVDLPPKKELQRFVHEKLKPFFVSVAAKPESPACVSVPIAGRQHPITINYDPSIRPSGDLGSYLSYQVPYSFTRNPVSRVLKDKQDHLRDAKPPHPAGIILCDGDSVTLQERVFGSSAFKLSQLVRDFFENTESVAFVQTLAVETKVSTLTANTTRRLKGNFFWNPFFGKSPPDCLLAALTSAIHEFPTPSYSPDHAVARLKARSFRDPRQADHYFTTHLSPSMNESEFRISARGLAALLSGSVSPDQFRQDHELFHDASGRGKNLFKREVESGKMIVAASIEADPNADDDWVVLKFGGRDPAASRFRVSSPLEPH